MGFVLASALCANCRQPFTFNPMLVPSVVITGRREPLCFPCVTWANTERQKRGLATFTVFPHAYDAIDETMMVWD
jgi:hypothetical protein